MFSRHDGRRSHTHVDRSKTEFYDALFAQDRRAHKDDEVRLVTTRGECVWHQHDETDECS